MYVCVCVGWQNSGPLDSTRGDSVSKIYVRIGRVVVRSRAVGGDVVRRTSVLELVQSGCDQEHREGLSSSSANGLSGGIVPADARLLAKTAHASAQFLQHRDDPGQFGPATANTVDHP